MSAHSWGKIVTASVPQGPVPDLPSGLARLQKDLLVARSAYQVVVRRPQRHPEQTRAAASRLLGCLEDFTAELRALQLPVPHRLREELRLLQSLTQPVDDA